MNVRLLRLFHKFPIIPRYMVKMGEYYELIGVAKDDRPYPVQGPEPKLRCNIMYIGKDELAKLTGNKVEVDND